MFDVNGRIVSADIRQSSFPIRAVSKSILQGKVGQFLKEKYPRAIILEEFTCPGSRLSVDYFLPDLKLVIEISGVQHQKFTPHFHGPITGTKFAKQKNHDQAKALWAETNGFKFVEIFEESDMDKLCQN